MHWFARSLTYFDCSPGQSKRDRSLIESVEVRIPAWEVASLQNRLVDGDLVFQFVLGCHHHIDDGLHLFRTLFRRFSQFFDMKIEFVTHFDTHMSFRIDAFTNLEESAFPASRYGPRHDLHQ